MSYAVLQEALRVLGVGERASLGEIKTRHRELVKRHHPDTSPAGESDTIREINAAYQVLQAYVAAYRFSFTEEEFYEQNPEERVWQQFADDPLCGNR